MAAALLICSCGSVGDREPAPEPSAGPAPEPHAAVVELRLGEPVSFGARDLVLRDIQDSRCPTDVLCVWEGEVVVKIELLGAEGGPGQSVALRLPERAGSGPPAAATVDGLSLRLLAVSPIPSAHEALSPADYVVRLEIET